MIHGRFLLHLGERVSILVGMKNKKELMASSKKRLAPVVIMCPPSNGNPGVQIRLYTDGRVTGLPDGWQALGGLDTLLREIEAILEDGATTEELFQILGWHDK